MKKEIQIPDLSKLKKYFRGKKHIAAVYLFGSFAEKATSSFSDVDLAVLYPKNHTFSPAEEKLELTLEISRILGNDNVDIHILTENIGLPFLSQVFKYGKVLADNDPERRLAYEDIMSRKIFDFQPVIRQYLSVMNERLGKGTYGNR